MPIAHDPHESQASLLRVRDQLRRAGLESECNRLVQQGRFGRIESLLGVQQLGARLHGTVEGAQALSDLRLHLSLDVRAQLLLRLDELEKLRLHGAHDPRRLARGRLPCIELHLRRHHAHLVTEPHVRRAPLLDEL